MPRRIQARPHGYGAQQRGAEVGNQIGTMARDWDRSNKERVDKLMSWDPTSGPMPPDVADALMNSLPSMAMQVRPYGNVSKPLWETFEYLLPKMARAMSKRGPDIHLEAVPVEVIDEVLPGMAGVHTNSNYLDYTRPFVMAGQPPSVWEDLLRRVKRGSSYIGLSDVHPITKEAYTREDLLRVLGHEGFHHLYASKSPTRTSIPELNKSLGGLTRAYRRQAQPMPHWRSGAYPTPMTALTKEGTINPAAPEIENIGHGFLDAVSRRMMNEALDKLPSSQRAQLQQLIPRLKGPQ